MSVRKFKLVVALVSGKSYTKNIVLKNDSETVIKAFENASEYIKDNKGDFETFSFYNGKNECLFKCLFTEEDFEDEDPILCRHCGCIIESECDMYVENTWSLDHDHHCGDCHDILYTKEAWDALYNEFNPIDKDEVRTSGDSYYYTTAP